MCVYVYIYIYVYVYTYIYIYGFPGGSDGKGSACHAGGLSLIPRSGRSPGEGNALPTPVLLPGEFHGQRSLAVTVHGVAKNQI